eukprot:TRINITY_DN7132_c0_g1_i1.p1 TRINITY_DN7132_c0_g1~~TRINITY_DN7132_c0_g1_i1.p1  ORF type:complete len:550 (-),score=173.58 TRINITY_DN7132_c0_g1_i1:365-2014(-)
MSDLELARAKVEEVASKQNEWHNLPYGQKLDLLRQIQNAIESNLPRIAAHSDTVRGYTTDGPFSGLVGVGYGHAAGLGAVLSAHIDLYTRLAAGTPLVAPHASRRVKDQVVVTCFPNGTFEKIMNSGCTGELWLEPGVEFKQVLPQEQPAGVCLILGAGNNELHSELFEKLFVANKVAIFKPNPVNAAGGMVELIFAPLIERGYLGVVPHSNEIAAMLVNHPSIDEMIMTGGCASYDRIVWGPPDEQACNKKAGKKQISKKFEAELGAVSPVIIVPGTWTNAEVDHQAAQIASMKVFNGSHICASPQVLVVDRSWPQRQAFLDKLKEKFVASTPENCFYPGSKERYERLKSAYPNADVCTRAAAPAGSLPIVLVRDAAPDSVLTKEEAFAPLIAEVALPTDNNPATFLKAAVDYANDQLFGTLSGSIFIDPRTEAANKEALEEAIANMRYGAIGINAPGGAVAPIPPLTWGAFPGHSETDIQSGIGKVNNAWLVDRPQKAVLRTPFVSPAHWLSIDSKFIKVLSRAAWFSVRQGWWRFFAVLSAALTGY